MSRFATVSCADVETIIEDKNVVNTKKGMFNVLIVYWTEENVWVDSVSKEELDTILSIQISFIF